MDLIPDFFGRKRRRRERDLELKVEVLISVVNDLLWNLDTLPMSFDFNENWNLLQDLDKRD